MSKSPSWVLEPTPLHPGRLLRRWLAFALRRIGVMLTVLGRRIHVADEPALTASGFVEFHAEAGAPEGALFVDGVRIGTLPGVTRL
jgi:hypothetical protein